MDASLELLKGLLEIYSPTGQEAAAVAWLAEQMARLGFRAEVDGAGNAVGTLGEGPGEVVLLGHIDTVTGRIPVRVEGDRLYGRGAVDARGPLAAFVAAAHRAGAVRGRRLVVIGAVGEEGDSRGAKFVRDRYRPAVCIIGEPSGWDRLTLGYKGSAWFEVRVERPAAHTASGAESAPEAAVACWNAMVAWAAARNAGRERVFEQVSPTLREMASGSDGFSEWARLRIGARLPPGLAVEGAAAELAGAAGPGAEIRLVEGVPAFRAEKNTPLVRAMLAALRGAGAQPGFTLKSGTSDMNVVGPAWGCPILAYGPGDSALDHTPEEHISLAEFERAVAVLARALADPRLCGAG